MDQRLLAASPRFRSATLADPRVSAYCCDIAHLLHNFARDRKSSRASRALHRPAIRESQLGLAPHGRERIGRARLYHFPSAPFHRAQIQSPISASQTRSAQPLRRLFDDGLRISERLRLKLLHRRVVSPHPPSDSRLIEFLSIDRLK